MAMHFGVAQLRAETDGDFLPLVDDPADVSRTNVCWVSPLRTYVRPLLYCFPLRLLDTQIQRFLAGLPSSCA